MKGGLVLDASVVINILASAQAETILRVLPAPRIVVAVTSREVFRHPLDPSEGGDPLAFLLEQGALERIALPEQAEERFIELVGGAPPNDLDDGEAATLATAEALGLTAAVDERKGRRVATLLMPEVELVTSTDLFRWETVQRALGDGLADAVFSALFHARMRVLHEDREWIVSLIGEERAGLCGSLRRRS